MTHTTPISATLTVLTIAACAALSPSSHAQETKARSEPAAGQAPAGAARPQNPHAGDFPDLTKTPTLFVVAYAHLDTQWRWCYPQVIREYIANTLNDNFRLIEKYPNYTFNFSGSRRYQMMREYYPELYERLKREIADGRWFPCGSSVDENDANVPSGESYIRHVLYGNNFFRKEFGVASDEYMLPDCFGFPAAVPSLLAHAGVKQFSTQKLTWNAVVPIPFKVGVWNGPDGRGVVAALDPGAYVGEVLENLADSAGWSKRIAANGKVSGVFADFHYYGTGDIGGAPTERSVAMMEASLATNGATKIFAGSADQLVHAITPEMRAKLPTYSGELQLTEHSAGSITSQAYMKRWNRKNELLADDAEKASVAAMWLGGREYPNAALEDAWTLVLGSQMHDILPGTSHPRAYDLSWNDEILAANRFSSILTDAASVVAGQMDTSGPGAALVVFNPLSTEREDVVEAEIPGKLEDGKTVSVIGPDGSPAAAQVVGKTDAGVRIAFVAKAPPVGFGVYHAVLNAPSAAKVGELTVSDTGLENSRYVVKLNQRGDVSSIFDKQAGREILSAPATLALHYENPREWPAWNQDWADRQLAAKEIVGGSPRVRIVEDGPARVALEVTREVGSSTFTQRIRLAAGGAADRVEFDCTIDWAARERSLRAAFPLSVSNPVATYDLQTGTIERGNGHPKQFEYAFQQWFDLTDAKGDYGVTVISDSKYGADKPSDNLVRLTLLHTPGVRGGYQDQATQDIGRHHVLYAIAAHQGDWRTAQTSQVAARLNQPLRVFSTDAHPGPLGRAFSLAKVSDPNVRIVALKKAEDGNEVIVRLRELTGKAASGVAVRVGSAVTSAREVDGQERPIGPAAVRDGALVADIGGYELRAFALSIAPSQQKAPGIVSTTIPLAMDTDVVALRTNRADGEMGLGGLAYPGEQFPQTVFAEGVRFTLAPATSGAQNALSCRGQTISLPAGTFNRVYLLAASSSGDVLANITAGERTTACMFRNWTGMLGQWDRRLWHGEVPEQAFDWKNELAGIEPGYINEEPVAWYASHLSTPSGDAHYQYCYMFKVAVDLPPGATSIRLPDDPRVKVFAATAVLHPSPATMPAAPLFDTLGARTQDAPRVVFDSNRLNDVTEVHIEPRLFWQAGNIRYTLDGSAPNESSPAYTAPLLISTPTTVTVAIKDAKGAFGPMTRAVVNANDATPPSVTDARATYKDARIRVEFSEPIDPASAAASHFTVEPSLNVVEVAMSGDRALTVTLASPPVTDTPYRLTITGITDRAPAANTLAPTTRELIARGPVFTLNPVPREAMGQPIRDLPGLPVKGTDSWTLNLFVRLDKQPDNRTIIAGFGTCDDSVDGAARYLSKFAGGLHFWTRNRDVATKTPLLLNQWQMLTATYDGQTLRVYHNAREVGSRKTRLADDQNVVHIAPVDPWERKRRFEGDIKSLTIWNSCLSPEALRSLLDVGAEN